MKEEHLWTYLLKIYYYNLPYENVSLTTNFIDQKLFVIIVINLDTNL